MNNAKALVFRILSGALVPAVATTAVVLSATTLVACADENDPKTWVKRLDDPAQRTPAIKRLNEMFDSAMSASNNNREDAKVQAVVEVAAEPLAKSYIAGNLDEKTRKDLMKLLAGNQPFHDANKRTAVAAAAVFLAMNGQTLTASDHEIVDLCRAIERGSLEAPAIAGWLKAKSTPRG